MAAIWEETSYSASKQLVSTWAFGASGSVYPTEFEYDLNAVGRRVFTFKSQMVTQSELDALETARSTRGATTTITDNRGIAHEGQVVALQSTAQYGFATDYYEVTVSLKED